MEMLVNDNFLPLLSNQKGTIIEWCIDAFTYWYCDKIKHLFLIYVWILISIRESNSMHH